MQSDIFSISGKCWILHTTSAQVLSSSSATQTERTSARLPSATVSVLQCNAIRKTNSVHLLAVANNRIQVKRENIELLSIQNRKQMLACGQRDTQGREREREHFHFSVRDWAEWQHCEKRTLNNSQKPHKIRFRFHFIEEAKGKSHNSNINTDNRVHKSESTGRTTTSHWTKETEYLYTFKWFDV